MLRQPLATAPRPGGLGSRETGLRGTSPPDAICHRGSEGQGEPPNRLVHRKRAYGEETERCWNCGSSQHFAHRCAQPWEGGFCYQCGRPGETIKSCPACGEAWRAEGPYVRGRSNIGPAHPRHHGVPPGSRKAHERSIREAPDLPRPIVPPLPETEMLSHEDMNSFTSISSTSSLPQTSQSTEHHDIFRKNAFVHRR